MSLSPADLRPVLDRLGQAGFRNVVVGGQAVNLWATRYDQADDPRWTGERPYTSEDLDFLGSPADALGCARALPGARATINRDPGLAGPNTGLVLAPFGQGRLRVDLLAFITGVGTTEALREAVDYAGRGKLAGLSLRVLHPLHCLESKLACLQMHDQRGRQDAKHARLSVLIVHEWLRGVLERSGARPTLNVVEALGDLAVRADALRASRLHGVVVEDAVPLGAIRERAGQPGGEILGRFLTIRQPQLWEQIAEKRREDHALYEALARRQSLADAAAPEPGE